LKFNACRKVPSDPTVEFMHRMVPRNLCRPHP
jgi:hypothetical protein